LRAAEMKQRLVIAGFNKDLGLHLDAVINDNVVLSQDAAIRSLTWAQFQAQVPGLVEIAGLGQRWRVWQ
jgi:hypothetical protein